MHNNILFAQKKNIYDYIKKEDDIDRYISLAKNNIDRGISLPLTIKLNRGYFCKNRRGFCESKRYSHCICFASALSVNS